MADVVHRHAPVRARWRALLAMVTGVPGLVLLVWGLAALTAVPAEPVWVVLALLVSGGLLAGIGGQLGRGLVGEAEAAPRESNPALASRRRAADRDDDPVRVLQERYARGELGEAEFDHRMERLLESDREREGTNGEREAASWDREPAGGDVEHERG